MSASAALPVLSRLAEALLALFPGNAKRHNCVTALEGGQKRAPVRRRGAGPAEYARHLDPTAYAGVGTLGVFPARRSAAGGWVTSFVALDCDATPPEGLQVVTDALIDSGVFPYLTRGTTGRGAHLYLFLAEPLELEPAHHAARTLAAWTGDLLQRAPVEYRPSSPDAEGSAIFLPYRGAALDGLGFNPLLDPAAGLVPIALAEAERRVHRTPPHALLALAERIATAAPEPAEAAPSTFDAPVVLEPQERDAAWQLELERVRRHWVEGKRQTLAMGLSAYGLVGLRLDVEVVRRGLLELVTERVDEERERRLQAFELTRVKVERGKPFAWRSYYESAGLTPPSARSGVTSDAVLRRLEAVGERLAHGRWGGQGGQSERAVLAALVWYAWRFGRLHPEGVSLTLGVRSLALRAGTEVKTVIKALKRLERAGRVRRDKTRRRRREEAGVLVLKVSEEKLLHSYSSPMEQLGGLLEWCNLYTHPAFATRRLGRVCGELFLALLASPEPMTQSAWARSIFRQPRDCRPHIARLVDHDLVDIQGGRCAVTGGWRDALERAARLTGADRAQERRRLQAEMDREVFRTRQEALARRALSGTATRRR